MKYVGVKLVPIVQPNNVYMESNKFSNSCGIYNLLESSE